MTRPSGSAAGTGWGLAARFAGMSTAEKWGYAFWLAAIIYIAPALGVIDLGSIVAAVASGDNRS